MGAALVRHDAGLALWRQGSVFAVMARPLAVEHWNDIAEPGADEPGDRAGGERSPRRIASGYQQLDRDSEGWVGTGTLHLGDGCAAEFVDRWSVRGDVLRVARQVTVKGDAPGGFLTELGFDVPAAGGWDEVQIFAPGMLYGAPDLINPNAIGGRRWLDEGLAEMRVRQDRLPAPLIALRLRDGVSIAALDPEPDGHTTLADARDVDATSVVDPGLRFGAMGLSALDGGGLRLGCWFPGAEGEVTYRGDTFPDGQLRRWRRRGHPLRHGLTQQHVREFRIAAGESFPQLTRRVWRWAWDRLRPAAQHQDIDPIRAALADQLTSAVVQTAGRTGAPHLRDPRTGQAATDRPAGWRSVLGFTGRAAECGWHLLREAERSREPQRAHQLGVAVLDTIATLPVSPPVGSGIDLRTGEVVAPTPRAARDGLVRLRVLGESGKAMMRAWRWERDRGRDHPSWLAWSQQLLRWLLGHQAADGSFPRAWLAGSDTVADPSGTSSCHMIPFLIEMWRALDERSHLDAAARCGEFSWASGHARGHFVGGTLDNPDVVDKEAGAAALEACLELFQATGERHWLDRACAAADFTETWIYLWDVPMPDGDDSQRGWKNGVATPGVQLIATGHSLVDQYLAWDVASFAKLAGCTGDDHYLEVARLLLHGTKAMLAVPGRCHDLAGPGWQQEHWSLAPPRGDGNARIWLPWVTCSQIESIVGLEDHDPALLARLSAPIPPA